MKIPASVAVERYHVARDELKARFPNEWERVVSLCSGLPRHIDPATVWLNGRDKPCWSNIKVAMGERIAKDIEGNSEFDSFEVIASDDWEIVMLERGPRWKKMKISSLRVKQFESSLSSFP